MTTPFQVRSEHVKRLNDEQLTQLLKDLLHAEAFKFGIAQRSVEVALNIRVGDGGEDGRISWSGNPEQTDYLPSRLTMFQNKATEMTAGEYAKEIQTKARRGQPSVLKKKVEEVLDEGGSYIVFTTQELNTQQKIDERIRAVRDVLEEHGKTYANTCDIRIYDASQIAGWVNQFVSTVTSVLFWVGQPVERGLKNFNAWKEFEEHSKLPFAAVESRKEIVKQIKADLQETKSCIRMMGLSGLGKTRTALQVFEEDEVLKKLVVYVDANMSIDILALLSDWISSNMRAILVVDNCDYQLHERLVREVLRSSSQISLLSLDYNFDSVAAPTKKIRLSALEHDELVSLLKPVYMDRLPDLDRIADFAQGFPQMAVLLAEARLSDDPRIGELTEDDLAKKLLWSHDENEDRDYLKIMQACSLFDFFGVEAEYEEQLIFISQTAGVDIDKTFECVQKYSDRGIIDRRGRLGQVVPKPLAIRLAGQWWSTSRSIRQTELLDSVPEVMVGHFCRQIEKMDFHTNVKALTEKLCGPSGPFGQAEVILSVRGSRLFRSFVVVNPEATSAALYRILTSLDQKQLLQLDGDVRRNLVWSLELLCFHANLFEESCWSLLLLASAENETWSNNATGIFSQLFRVQLSGTEAKPSMRFQFLERALDRNELAIDLVVLKALEQVVSTYGGSRTVGAEYQGSRPPLEEWKPTIWQEIFDFWQNAFNLLLRIYKRGSVQKERVMSIVGHTIRGFVSRGRIEMLDVAIREIVDDNGIYWPQALESIKTTLEHDSNGMKPEGLQALNDWLRILSPETKGIEEKLKIIVTNPPWEHRKGDDGHYIDIAGENAKKLAREISGSIETLYEHLTLVMQGNQKQAFIFGQELALALEDPYSLVDIALKALSTLDSPNISFCSGLLNGVFNRSAEKWQFYIDLIRNNKALVGFYPEFIRTGKIQLNHLDVLLELISTGLVEQNGGRALSYGSVTDNLSPSEVSKFCSELSMFSDLAAWVALDILFMYCHGNANNFNATHQVLKELVTRVPIGKDSKGNQSDMYHWYDTSKRLLANYGTESFAEALVKQILSYVNEGFDHSDIWHSIKPLLAKIMEEYGAKLWPLFSERIISASSIEKYWLTQLLERENSFSNQQVSVLSVLELDQIISWCNVYPKIGPVFVARAINIFESKENQQVPTALFVSLLENFGEDERVQDNLSSNYSSRGWAGSLVPYLEKDRASFFPLLDHPNNNVRSWIRGQISSIDRQIEYELKRDAERDAGVY